MEITAQMVKDLREATGAGMMDSKKALVETNGNMEEAIEYLRKKGLASAEKKAGRIAAEGLVVTLKSDDLKTGVIVEVNSETDFVAKNEKFRNYVQDVAKQVMKSSSKNIEDFLEEKWFLDDSKTVKEELSSQIAIIGENMNIRRFDKIENTNGFVFDYIHAGGKIAVLISINSNVINDDIKLMAKNICMQIAAMRPEFLDRSEINKEFENKEKEIYLEEAKNDPKNQNKPENIINQMVEGRFNKRVKEICLLEQEYVISSEDKMSVNQYVSSIAKKNNADIKINKFIRYETGEGIEKKNEDFAMEVAKQIK